MQAPRPHLSGRPGPDAVKWGTVESDAARKSRRGGSGNELTTRCELAVKASLRADRRAHHRSDAVLASNTSSIPIMKIAAATKNPSRCWACTSSIRCRCCRSSNYQHAGHLRRGRARAVRERGAGQAGGAVRVTGRASSSTRCWCPTCCRRSGWPRRGVATVEDIDTAVVAGLSHPMGPLRLSDLIGLDTMKLIADSMFDEFKEPDFTARRRCCCGWSRPVSWARSPARASTRTESAPARRGVGIDVAVG